MAIQNKKQSANEGPKKKKTLVVKALGFDDDLQDRCRRDITLDDNSEDDAHIPSVKRGRRICTCKRAGLLSLFTCDYCVEDKERIKHIIAAESNSPLKLIPTLHHSFVNRKVLDWLVDVKYNDEASRRSMSPPQEQETSDSKTTSGTGLNSCLSELEMMIPSGHLVERGYTKFLASMDERNCVRIRAELQRVLRRSGTSENPLDVEKADALRGYRF